MSLQLRNLVCSTAAALVFVLLVQPVCGDFVAADWDNDTIHILDDGLNSTFSFATAVDPNGVTSDGELIFSGHFSSQEVIAYDLSGREQFRWSASLSLLQGMTIVGNELAIAQGGFTEFYDPMTGAFIRSFANSSSGVEGLAFDGDLIWHLSDVIEGYDAKTGELVTTIVNAASDEPFGGTGIADAGPGRLALAGTTGNWFIVSSADGSVISTGNNGVNTFGLGSVPNAIPEPSTCALVVLLSCGSLIYRRRS